MFRYLPVVRGRLEEGRRGGCTYQAQFCIAHGNFKAIKRRWALVEEGTCKCGSEDSE